jgi:hypothetical protein
VGDWAYTLPNVNKAITPTINSVLAAIVNLLSMFVSFEWIIDYTLITPLHDSIQAMKI